MGSIKLMPCSSEEGCADPVLHSISAGVKLSPHSHSYPEYASRWRTSYILPSRSRGNCVPESARYEALVRRRACNEIVHGRIPQARRSMPCRFNSIIVINESYTHLMIRTSLVRGQLVRTHFHPVAQQRGSYTARSWYCRTHSYN